MVVGEVSGGLREVIEDMTGASVMLRGVEKMADRLVTEGKVKFVMMRGAAKIRPNTISQC